MHSDRLLLAHPETILLALSSAILFAVTSVVQHSAATEVDARCSLRPRLLLELVRRPRWLLGNVTDLAAYGLQFLALRRGSLLVVQTLLVTGLLFILPLAAAVTHRHLSPKEWLSAVALVFSLSLFLALANPSRGRPRASAAGWLAVFAATGAAVGVLILGAPSEPGRARARRLGASCGVLFAVTAALAKQFGHLMNHGLLRVVSSWELYAWLVIAGFGFLVAQSALQAGPLDASMPLLIIADPLVAGLIGVVVFRERIVFDPLAALFEVASMVVIVVAVFSLSGSPLVAEAEHR